MNPVCLLSGLRKQGDGLSDAERNALRHFVTDRCVSPAFVHRLVREHGAASLLETFHLGGLPPDRALAFLLRNPGTFVIPKAASIGHVAENAGAAALELSAAEIAKIAAAFPRGAPQRGLPMI